MAEIIDFTAVLKRRRFIEYLTNGIELDLKEGLLEEFKYRMETFLNSEFSIVVHHDYTSNVLHLIDEHQINVLDLEFKESSLLFLLPDGWGLQGQDYRASLGRAAVAVISLWEWFEAEIPFIVQDYD